MVIVEICVVVGCDGETEISCPLHIDEVEVIDWHHRTDGVIEGLGFEVVSEWAEVDGKVPGQGLVVAQAVVVEWAEKIEEFVAKTPYKLQQFEMRHLMDPKLVVKRMWEFDKVREVKDEWKMAQGYGQVE
eukprot:s4608_g4.t1